MWRRIARADWVYPRECGGTSNWTQNAVTRTGLSPRVRGTSTRRVYPRGCGGTHPYIAGGLFVAGLSPRVRGNPQHHHDDGRRYGSIPAGAGEPRRTSGPPSALWVYPRGCGGTVDPRDVPWCGAGLSPRVRGNPEAALNTITADGSIPAGAGEPRWPRTNPHRLGVYPRGCGGTPSPLAARRSNWGLSPRVRGNLFVPTN